jgi:hypothetical protein
MQRFQDIWSNETQSFLTWNEARTKFQLDAADYPRYTSLTQAAPVEWTKWLTEEVDSTWPGDFIGIFDHAAAHFPRVIFLVTREFKPSLTRRQDQLYIPVEIPSFEIGGSSMILQARIHPPGREGEDWIGMTMRRVRVVPLARGSNHGTLKVLLFAGITNEMLFDPGRWNWRGQGPLLSYTFKLGRKLLNPRARLLRSMADKWTGILPASYEPNWNEVWSHSRPQKEAGFLWFVYHKAVAVNHWRAQIGPHINSMCVCCPNNVPETILHQFIFCTRTRLAWEYGLTILYKTQGILPVSGH